MNKIELKATDTTLGVILDKENNTFEFKGRSRPENASDFYQVLFDWVKEYSQNPLPEIVLKFQLDYFNSSSAKLFIQLLEKFERINSPESKVIVEWYYLEGDDDILEAGEDFSDLIELPFKFCTIN